jgi:hypothetical protein
MTAMTKHNTGDVPQPTGNWPLDGCAYLAIPAKKITHSDAMSPEMGAA